MFRRLESLFSALGLLAACGGAYFFAALTSLSLVNTWNILALVAAALSFFGVSVSIHGHKAHTRGTIIVGFLMAAGLAIYVKGAYGGEAGFSFLPEAALLFLTLLCAEVRVFIKEPATRQPEHVGAAKAQHARKRG